MMRMRILESSSTVLNEVGRSQELFLALMSVTEISTNEMSVGLFSNDWQVFQQIAKKGKTPWSFYQWKTGEMRSLLPEVDFAALSGIWLSADNCDISFFEDVRKPLFDWNERKSGKWKTTITMEVPPSEASLYARTLKAAATKCLEIQDQSLIKSTTSHRKDHVRVSVIASVSNTLRPEILKKLMPQLSSNGNCCCEYTGNPGQIFELNQKNGWKTTEVPLCVRPTSFFRGNYAIDPLAPLRAVPNMEWETASAVMAEAWANMTGLELFVIGREFLSWRAGNQLTRRTQGNFLRLWLDSGAPKLQVGVEEFNDEQSISESVIEHLQSVGKSFGIDLRSV